MKLIQRALATTAALLLLAPLAACSSEEGTPGASQPIATEEVSSEATPEQLASIVAKYEQDWREAIGSQQECKGAQGYAALSDATPAEKARAADCLLVLEKAADDAGTASAELKKLTAPSSMVELVADTVRYLDQIAQTDLATICGGEPYGVTCTDEDMAFTLAYMRLEEQLDAWGPYL